MACGADLAPSGFLLFQASCPHSSALCEPPCGVLVFPGVFAATVLKLAVCSRIPRPLAPGTIGQKAAHAQTFADHVVGAGSQLDREQSRVEGTVGAARHRGSRPE